jgi:molybdopterin converting factor small subunit
MNVTVRLFATFRDWSPTHPAHWSFGMDVAEHETVRELIKTLSLPDELPRIILVNGIFASENHHLREGDTISIFPPLIGGRP